MASAVSLKIQQNQSIDLNDIVITVDQLESDNRDKSHYFEIAFGEEVIGFVEQNELKSYLEQNPEKYAETFVRKVGQDVWMPATQQTFLQRRKPTLVKDNEIVSTDRFFYLKEGQKIGPFSLVELRKKIETREILVTEMIVPEKGGTWFKLFELNTFDRRLQSPISNQLPQMPDAHIFEMSCSSSKKKDRFEERDAMAGLAYIGQIKSGKITENQDEVSQAEKSEFEEDTAVRMIKRQAIMKRLMVFGLLIIASITLGWFFMFRWNNVTDIAGQAANTTTDSAVKTDAPVLTPIKMTSPLEKRNQIKRTIPNNAIRPIKRAPTSIKDSTAYRDQQENLLNYDQGQNPIESDPVRDQLSPETLNPQPIEDTQSQNWVNPENIQQANPAENPFDGEVSN